MVKHDYSEGKIYIIKFKNDPSLVYVGSTKSPLNERFSRHKSDYDVSLYKYINEDCDGNWNDWYIELYEDYPCLNRKELDRREGEITFKFKNDSNYNCINERIAGRTYKQWCEENKEKVLEYKNKYYESNNKKLNENRKEKIICECGCIINKSSKARHLKSKKHDIQIHKTITNNT